MTTIILVHGFCDTGRRMHHMAKFLRNRGWKALVPTLLPSNGSVMLEELSAQLQSFINNSTAPGEQVSLVGYSMGGLICRYYLQRHGGLSKTKQFISISTPHHGTVTAHLFRKPGILQMRPQSLFLQDLNKDAVELAQIPCTALYTPMDLSIIPARSCIVSFAKTIRFFVPIHVLMVYDRRVLLTIHRLILAINTNEPNMYKPVAELHQFLLVCYSIFFINTICPK